MAFINFSQQVDKKAIFLLFGCYCINPRLILDEKYATNANDYPENFHRMIWGALVNIAKKGNVERISPIDIENEIAKELYFIQNALEKENIQEDELLRSLSVINELLTQRSEITKK